MGASPTRTTKQDKYLTVEQQKKPVVQYYYSEAEWTRLGCGPLPDERNRSKLLDAHAKGNPKVDNNVVKGYN